jgi:hypothetical protein
VRISPATDGSEAARFGPSYQQASKRRSPLSGFKRALISEPLVLGVMGVTLPESLCFCPNALSELSEKAIRPVEITINTIDFIR